jgi:hypothetical protein
MAASGGAEPSQILAAIEVPHGPVVETLIERGFKVHAINPKQMDRFRDRFTMAGAKDDSRDAEVMASALRTDPRCFRPLAAADPIIVELREWSRIAEDLGERNRLVNRLREQLWRYFPALLELEEATAFGVMHIDAKDNIIAFLEKPKNPPPMPGKPDAALCSTGIYVFETSFLIDLLRRDAADQTSNHDFGKDIVPYLVKNAKRWRIISRGRA